MLSERQKGTGLLRVGERNVSISLLPPERQKRVSIPSSQFVAMRPALEERAKLVARSGAKDTAVLRYEMCPKCSFVNDGVVYNLVGFTSDTLLLQAIPYGEIILVRAGASE